MMGFSNPETKKSRLKYRFGIEETPPGFQTFPLLRRASLK